jgi:hypothetical protein
VSISILILPLAAAAATGVAGAVSGRKAGNQVICEVQTRMRDLALLTSALETTGATVATDGASLVATWSDVQATLTRDSEGIWSAHISGKAMTRAGEAAERRAVELIQEVDRAYGRLVQAAVVSRIRNRAPEHGLRLESETVSGDDAVTLVFEVEEAKA